jgi:hypothetical protein
LKGTVTVAEIAVEVAGHLYYGKPKTKAGRRTVTLPRSVVAILNDHLTEYTDTDTDIDANAFVFTAPEGAPLRVPPWLQRNWKSAIEAAGLAPLRPHDLRHTAMAMWIATGANPLEVSRRAGHMSVAFTLDRYGHLFPEANSGVADRLDALFIAAKSDWSDAVISAISSNSDGRRADSAVVRPFIAPEQGTFWWTLGDTIRTTSRCWLARSSLSGRAVRWNSANGRRTAVYNLVYE